MKRAAVTAVLFLSSLTLRAQNGSPSGSAAAGFPGAEVRHEPGGMALTLPPVAGCPIGMQASQGVWDHTMKVREGGKERIGQPFGQKISLTLKDTRPARITEATVRVHGLNGKSRMLQTGDLSSSSDATKTIHLSFDPQEEESVTGTLWIPGFTAVTYIELQQVSYSDGSTWKVSGTNLCKVQPDPLMLISNR